MQGKIRTARPYCRAGVCAALLALGGCAASPPDSATTAAAAPVPAGAARIWFYRDYEPSLSLNVANVALNSAPTGSVQPDGAAFYRDVTPGHYHVTVDSYGIDINQDKYVDPAPGRKLSSKCLPAT